MPEGLVIGGGGNEGGSSANISGDGSEYYPYEIASPEDLREVITTIRAKEISG